MSEETKAPETRGKRFGYLAMTLVLLFGLVAGSLAVAGLGMYRHHAMGFGHGWRGGDWAQEGPRGEPFALQRVERMVGFAARRLDATEDQKKRLTEIVTAAARDLLPMRAKMRDARRQARQILTAPTIDRTALEALRAAQMAEADAASRRLAQAIADIGDVLTPDQRAKLARRMDF
ncbi:MAG: Spy/CpxP family protein refolding chaperone [Alphaproteobacteria bacterium]